MADDGRELLDAAAVARMLGVTTDWVYEQSRRGRIPTITLGRYRRYRRAAIEAWLLSIERGNLRPSTK
jgi:excisionase family DNA binding protein